MKAQADKEESIQVSTKEKRDTHSQRTKITKVSLQNNSNYTTEIEKCLIIETIKQETVESVGLIVEGLGFEDVQIRELNSKSFLAYFEYEDNLEHVDMDFLEIGFSKVKQVIWEDLIPSRKTWVECRGLPIGLWTEDNLKALIGDWGDIICFASIIDDEHKFQYPTCLIETKVIRDIEESGIAVVNGNEWNYRIVEVKNWNQLRTNWDEKMGNKIGNIWGNNGTNTRREDDKDLFLDPEAQSGDDSGVEEALNGERIDKQDIQIHVSKADLNGGDTSSSESEVEYTDTCNSLINPLTPSPPELNIPCIQNQENWNWCTRESVESVETEPSVIKSKDSIVCSVLEDSKGDDLSIRYATQPALIKDLRSLQIKSNRGRPRKIQSHKVNKAFIVPNSRKKKGNIGLQMIENNPVSRHEAQEIFESGVQMGLIPIENEQQYIQRIRERLL